jgi:hypothetical protein
LIREVKLLQAASSFLKRSFGHRHPQAELGNEEMIFRQYVEKVQNPVRVSARECSLDFCINSVTVE